MFEKHYAVPFKKNLEKWQKQTWHEKLKWSGADDSSLKKQKEKTLDPWIEKWLGEEWHETSWRFRGVIRKK